MKSKKEPTYEDLKKQFSEEEIADAFVLRKISVFIKPV
jgi:hypothetical protein